MDSEAKAVLTGIAIVALAVVAMIVANVFPFYYYGYCEQYVTGGKVITKCLDD